METCGKVKIDGIIELPDYMVGKIDPESICVQITPIGVYQELFVDSTPYGAKVIIRNGAGGPINAYYHIHAKALRSAKVSDLDALDDHAIYRTTDI